jgi:hypothetical protein
MFGSSVLDVAIGVIFVYLVVGLVCTAANEVLASMFAWRSANLRDGVRNLLDGPNPQNAEWANKFFDHPLIQGLYRRGEGPSYIPSRTFALALTDLVLPGDPNARPSTAEELRAAIAASPAAPGLKQVLRVLLDEAERSNAAGQRLRLVGVLDIQKLDTVFNQLQQHIEIWFNNSMERVSGWYKRRVHAWTLAIAIAIVAALNLDSVLIARHLARDSALRAAIVAQAQQMAQEPASVLVATSSPAGTGPGSNALQDTTARAQLLQQRIAELNTVGIPLGWPDPDGPPVGTSWFILKFVGLLLTAAAASLGAPFWFDVLNRFISIRSAGKAPEESPKPPRAVPIPGLPGQPDGPAPPPETAAPQK